VKSPERREILEQMSSEINQGIFEARKFRGRRLDKAKIER
jgi:hypothetical protein